MYKEVLRGADSNNLLDGSELTPLSTPLYQDSFPIKHFEVLGPNFSNKVVKGGTSLNNCGIHNQHLWILFVWIFILNKALCIEVLGPNLRKKDILGTKFKKIIVEFKIGSLEYPFISSFISNKTFSSFETKVSQKKYFGDEN